MLPADDHSASIEGFLALRRVDETQLRLANEADSQFLLSLRLDPLRNRNISSTDESLSEQVVWMKNYALRYASGREAYFVIESRGEPVGSLRIYDYRPERNSFCWGSWIIRPGAPAQIAYQSVVLVYDLAFSALKFCKAHFDVRQGNVSVWKFHEKMGAQLTREDSVDRFYEYKLEEYRQARIRLKKFTQSRDFL